MYTIYLEGSECHSLIAPAEETVWSDPQKALAELRLLIGFDCQKKGIAADAKVSVRIAEREQFGRRKVGMVEREVFATTAGQVPMDNEKRLVMKFEDLTGDSAVFRLYVNLFGVKARSAASIRTIFGTCWNRSPKP